jgi:predicted DCC family thiol-disulfide oxidoreductase YuxK
VTVTGELTLLYDEGCAFCTWVAGLFRSTKGVLVAPIGSERGSGLLAGLTHEERYASVHVVEAGGRLRSGGDALPPLLRRVRGGRPAAWALERLPGVSAWGYALVTRHRDLLARVLRVDQARSVSRR